MFDLYDIKDMIPNLATEGRYLRNVSKIKGRMLDRPAVNEIIRPARIKDWDFENKLVALEWLDVPGAQTNVLLTYPIMGRDWGLYSLPYINDFCICAVDGSRVRILGWVARNTSRLRNLEPGEIMMESSTHATVYARSFPKFAHEKWPTNSGAIRPEYNLEDFIDGVIHISGSPENDPEHEGATSDCQVIVGRTKNIKDIETVDAPGVYSGLFKYLYQFSTSAGNQVLFDQHGNKVTLGSKNRIDMAAENWIASGNKDYSQFIQKDKTVDVGGDLWENVRASGQKQQYQLNVNGKYNVDTQKDMNLKSRQKCSMISQSDLTIQSNSKIVLKAPVISLNPSGGGSAQFEPLESVMKGYNKDDLKKTLQSNSSDS